MTEPDPETFRIGLFLSGLSGGGAQRRMLTLARGFAERGHAVDLIVVRPGGPFAAAVSPGVRIVALDPVAARLPVLRRHKGLWVAAAAPALAAYLRRSRPEVLLSTSNPANLAALWARRRAGIDVPVVVTVNVHLSAATGPRQAFWGGWLAALARRSYPQADAVIAISRGVAGDLARETLVPANRIFTVYNPLDLAAVERLAREPVAHPWLAAGEPPVLLAVGKLKRQKDFPTLLRAFGHLRRARAARLVILGEGEERRQLEKLAERLGIAADVALPGFVENPFSWMARAALFVLSSAWEGFSNALLEALASGCPVVSTDCPSGPAEILAGGELGALVPVGDDAALAAAMAAALDRPPDRARLRERARAFSIDAAVSGYLDVLRRVARKPPRLNAADHPRRLCLLIRSLRGGGMENMVATLAGGFAERGHDTTILAGAATGAMRPRIAPQVKVEELTASSWLAARIAFFSVSPGGLRDLAPFLLGPSPRMLRHLPALVRRLRDEPVDVLFSAGTQSNLVALWAKRLAGVRTRVVISERNTMSAVVAHARRRFRKAYPALARRTYGSADAIVAVSAGVADDLCRLTGLRRERVVVIPNPVVSAEMLCRAAEPVPHPWLTDRKIPVLLGAGRLHRQKDFPTLIRAFARVHARRPARLVILGEGGERARLAALGRALDVGDALDLPGYTANPYAWMARASVFVLSSAWEGTANVLIEAMACGCPVVSTDCPSGPADILAGGAYGPLVPVGDDDALAEAILSALDRPVERERLRARAALFDREASLDRHLELLLANP